VDWLIKDPVFKENEISIPSSTLPIWWAQRGSPATVVYLDAHLDLQRVADDAIATLRHCATIEEVRALEAPGHFDQSPRYAFGIENFLYAASRLESIDHLVWIAPPTYPQALLQSSDRLHAADERDQF
jgi:hypothetical protein